MMGDRLIIGVDYGTTYTGVAFCETSDTKFSENLIQVIQDWPTAHTMIETKDKPHVPRHMWTKLELGVPRTGEATYIRSEVEYIQRSPVQVVADFLTRIRQRLVKALDNRFGPALWRTIPITLVITVPAIWSDGAKNRTLQAFREAGFNRDLFPQLKRTITTTEPEAAAIYTLRLMRGSVQDDQLEVGDSFVVCDMGGGTVDLISYRISRTDPTTVEEITIGSGDQCGGSFVEREFISWLEDRLGLDHFEKIAGGPASACLYTCLPQKLARMIQEFSMSAKSGFSGTEEYYLRLPAALSGVEDQVRGISDGELHVDSSDMKHMFGPCLQKTRNLIADQVAKAKSSGKARLKFVFFVGGFAESPYMFCRLKNFCASLGLQAIKPAYAWSAIVRGAAAKGLEGDGNAVLMRKCRRHYGTPCSRPFVHEIHSEADSYISEYSGLKFATNQMQWLIKKGSDLHTSKETHAVTSLEIQFWLQEKRDVCMSLFACNQNDAPSLLCAENLYRVARISFNTGDIPGRFLSREYDPNDWRYFTAQALVHMSIQSAIEFSVTINGQDFGSVTVDYD
ncbi:Hsp70 family protein [Corynespora cassiicola Philippines]|uniref:Hsp70 family protein n=1 Tax=Corynespora cassiicola Philippines TaxID=1448308 RepID=A0A2T2N6B8_CORCC|nr:Hsp70 family protein [Corynespora cassiicola Philippines]